MLPNFYLALLAGAYKIGSADLASLYAEKSRACANECGVPDASIAAQIYLIRHLALLSQESSNAKAIRTRIREAVHTAPWDLDLRSYLSTEAADSPFVWVESLSSLDEEVALKALQQLKLETSRVKKLIRRDPQNMESWCHLSLLLLQAAQQSQTPKLLELSITTCNNALRMIDKEELPEERKQSAIKMQVLIIMSECVSCIKRQEHGADSIVLAKQALEIAQALGDGHQMYAQAQLGRIHLRQGNTAEGEHCLKEASAGGCRIAAMELGAFLLSQGKDSEAKKALHTYKHSQP